jgi:hypothetical protein
LEDHGEIILEQSFQEEQAADLSTAQHPFQVGRQIWSFQIIAIFHGNPSALI